MSTFRLEINLDNDAFRDPTELARLIRGVADSPDIASMGCRSEGAYIRDANGNTVGGWQIDEDR